MPFIPPLVCYLKDAIAVIGTAVAYFICGLDEVKEQKITGSFRGPGTVTKCKIYALLTVPHTPG
jgi:hypothetical protein